MTPISAKLEIENFGTEQMKELIQKLEIALYEAYNINVSVTFHKGEVIVNGLSNKCDELKTFIFIHGFLSGWENRNKTNMKIYNPGAG